MHTEQELQYIVQREEVYLKALQSKQTLGEKNDYLQHLEMSQDLHARMMIFGLLNITYESALLEMPNFLRNDTDLEEYFNLDSQSRSNIKNKISSILLSIYTRREKMNLGALENVKASIPSVVINHIKNFADTYTKEQRNKMGGSSTINFGSFTDTMGRTDIIYLISMILGYLMCLYEAIESDEKVIQEIITNVEEGILYTMAEAVGGTCNSGLAIRFYRMIELFCGGKYGFYVCNNYTSYYVKRFLNISSSKNNPYIPMGKHDAISEEQTMKIINNLDMQINDIKKNINTLMFSQDFHINLIKYEHITLKDSNMWTTHCVNCVNYLVSNYNYIANILNTTPNKNDNAVKCLFIKLLPYITILYHFCENYIITNKVYHNK